MSGGSWDCLPGLSRTRPLHLVVADSFREPFSRNHDARRRRTRAISSSRWSQKRRQGPRRALVEQRTAGFRFPQPGDESRTIRFIARVPPVGAPSWKPALARRRTAHRVGLRILHPWRARRPASSLAVHERCPVLECPRGREEPSWVRLRAQGGCHEILPAYWIRARTRASTSHESSRWLSSRWPSSR